MGKRKIGPASEHIPFDDSALSESSRRELDRLGREFNELAGKMRHADMLRTKAVREARGTLSR